MNKLLFFAIGLGLLYLTKTSIAGKRGFCKRLEQKVDHLTELFQNCSNRGKVKLSFSHHLTFSSFSL